MLNLVRHVFSLEAFVAFGLVLVSQTTLRFGAGFGIGELVLAAFIAIAAIQICAPRYKFLLPAQYQFIWWLMAFICFAMVPITLLNAQADLLGSSPRDLLAYLLSILLIYFILARRLDLPLLGGYVCLFLLLAVTAQYFLGGRAAWYFDTRFSGGAVNPNQLALYLACALIMLAIAPLGGVVRAALATGLVIVSVLTQSDALFLSLVAAAAAWCAMVLVPRSYLVPFSIFIGIPAMIALAVFVIETDLMQAATGIWRGSDEGNGRLVLFRNGFAAFFSSPFVWPFGLGAGNFSGTTGPFGDQEAHNTFIDFLTIGGVVGTTLLYYPLLRTLWLSYAQRDYFLAAAVLGLIVFSLFHFVARHPIYWVAVIAAIGYQSRSGARIAKTSTAPLRGAAAT